ncbi:MAG: hypothetical protein P1V35_07365 [Planctomycetota bacterium]|nr:hypothetical protein [Planctomycetota bacterium]
MDPGKESGLGPGEHKLSHKGKLIWRKSLPLTLRGARVTDTGRVIGVGRTEKRVGETGEYWWEREQRMLIIGADGAIIANEANRSLDERQVVVQAHLDRVLILTVDDSGHEVRYWRTYKLSTGEFEGNWSTSYPFSVFKEKALRGKAGLYLRESRPVPDTDLVLLHWWYTNYKYPSNHASDAYSKDGGVFSLVDQDGQTVWTLERREAYTIRNNEVEDANLERFVKSHGTIINTKSMGRFALWLPLEKTSTEFVAIRQGDGWEVSSQPPEPFSWQAPAPPEEAIPLPKLKLPLIAKTHLGPIPAQVPIPAVRDVWEFGFQTNGNLQFIRREVSAESMVLLDAEGAEAQVVPLPQTNPEGELLKWLSCHGNTWYAATAEADDYKSHKLYRFNPAHETLEAVEPKSGFRFPTISRLIPLGSGGFVLLGTYRYSNTSTTVLAKIAQDGDVEFDLSSYSLVEQGLDYFTPKDFAITADGLIAVLSVVGNDVEILSAEGKFIRTIDLETAWKKEPYYPTYIGADPDGGFWVEDDHQLWRMNSEGQLLTKIAPRFPDGSKIEFDEFQVAANGAIWKTDRRVLASFGADGGRGPLFGTPPSTESIADPFYAQIDRLGRILINDDSNGSWHVFDSEGAVLFACRLPDAVDTDDQPFVGIDGKGHVHIPSRDPEYESYLLYRFSPTGEPERIVKFPAHRMMFVRDTDSYWADTYNNFELFNAQGKAKVSVRRRPDRDWWHYVTDWQLSSDGSTLAVLDSGTLCLFDGAGENGSQITLPRGAGAWDVAVTGGWVALGGGSGHVALLDRRDQSFHKVVTPTNENLWRWGFSPSGRELWGVDIQAQELYRYALPQ